MAVTMRQRMLRSGDMHWQADIRVKFPDGSFFRERVKAPGHARSTALRWARAREAYLVRHGPRGKESHSQPEPVDVPTLAEFATRVLQDHVAANRLKPATRHNWEEVLRLYLIPQLGSKRLDHIGPLDIQRMKRRPLAPSTINMVLSKLKAMLRLAIQWDVIESMPGIKPLPKRARAPEFYDFEEYRQLLKSARTVKPLGLIVLRLGGDAGLRVGEMLALRWCDVDFARRCLMIVENEWRGQVGDPKGGSTRSIPMTQGLQGALAELPQTGRRVLDQGPKMYARKVDRILYRVQRGAGLQPHGPHILRHTFCSHLAMRGAPARTIQALAGHANSATTDRYMHLAPRTLGTAIDLLDR